MHIVRMGDDMEASIKVEHLCKSYGTHQVVKDISFTVEKGEIFAFLGPNGAGKSTTISILCTLLQKDAGKVWMEGYELGVHDAQMKKKLGIVFQESVLDDILTVEQNLELRCALYHMKQAAARKRVQELAAICQLRDIMHQRVHTLSGGQRRRCDIARALIPNPAILILDEPSTGLDPEARKSLWETITQLHEHTQMTIFMTTHYMEEAEIANHLCMIQKGRIVLDAGMEEIRKQYCGESLHLYPANRNMTMQVLQKHHIPFLKQEDVLVIETKNMFYTMSILRMCERYLERFEVHKERMEDVYLKILQENEG